jgi:lysophospholipase L1-like esterase
MQVSKISRIFVAAIALAFAPSVHTAPVDPVAKWEKEISAFEAKDKTNPPPKGAVLFIGSSSIRKWTTLADDFPNHKVINRGFGGSHIIDSVHFADRIVWPYEPRLIVMFAGGNDIAAGKSPQQVAGDFKAFIARVREKLPDVPIIYVSIPPAPSRWAQRDRIVEANRLISEYIKTDPKLTFIDIYSKELTSDGKPREELFGKDRLHMNADGYALWKSIIEPYLDRAK